MAPQFDSDYKKRRYLERRGIDTEGLRKNQLNVQKLISRQKQDRYLERTGQLNYQGGPRPPFLPPSGPNMTPGTNAGGSAIQPVSQFTDPVTGKIYDTQGGAHYTDPATGLLRKNTGAIWLSGAPKPVEPVKPPNMLGLATVQDALNGQANWSDIAVDQRKKLLSDTQFYETNQITKYPKWMQQQILADPSFDWKQLPKWQRYYYELSSSPAGMGAVQGGLMGSFGGPVGGLAGTAIGAGLGYWAGKSGYDVTKEAWQQKNVAASAFGFMNYAAEFMEKTIGFGAQAVTALADKDPNTRIQDVFTKEGWNAGAVAGETFLPALQSALKGDGKLDWNDALRLIPSAFFAERLWNLVSNPEKFKGEELFLGANVPVELEQSWSERMTEARERIKNGENYREVMADFQTGVMGQIGDMAIQAVADPLNVMPRVETRVLGKIAEKKGDTVAAAALKGSKAPMEAAQRYKNLVQTGEALKINPEFKVDQMGAFSRMVAGVNEQGQIKAGPFSRQGLLDAPKKKTGFIEEMTSLTPQSRAQIGAGMFYENIGALLTRFDDPHEAGKYLRALSNSDMETWKELGSRFADSPEFYTVLPALKDFNATALDGLIALWDSSQANRDMLTRVSDVLGENPSKLLDDLAERGTADQDFARIRERLQQSTDPNAKVLLGEIEAGRFTPDTLKQIVDIYTGDGKLAWHPNQVKAQMLNALGSHFDKWVAKRMMLDQSPEATSAFFRTAALMKQAQSILLLGASPGYAIQNGLSNMVHRAASGVYGYLTPTQINGWMDKFGATPARFEEGVGIGGMVEQATGSTKVRTEAVTKAVKGQGPLTDARNKLGNLSRKMPFSRLSSWFEKTESKQAFAIGMKQFWNQSWRRGVGFKQMGPELVSAIQSMGIDPNRIYGAIEAGLNQAEIEKALYGRFEGVQSRSLIDEAARKTGLSSQQAADMLDKVGVLDTLDSFLKGQTTRDGVSAAFRRAERVAQDYMDMQAGEDLKAQAEHVTQRVTIEQPAAAFEVIQKANAIFTDTWMDHYFRFGDVMNDLTLLDDPAMKSKAIENAYAISDAEFRRTNARNAANYKGIFDAWGKSGNPEALNTLAAMGEIDTAMKQAYDFMRQNRKEFFDKYRNDFDNPARWDDWEKSQYQIGRAFDQAFKTKHNSEVKAGKSLGNIFEGLYGKAAGEAARLWWEDVVKFNDEIVAREKKARAEFAHLPGEQREAAKQKYYSETKILAIAEAQKINEAGIARLERVVRGGGDQGAVTPKPPTEPTPSPTPLSPAETSPQIASDLGGVRNTNEINSLIAQAEQRVAADTAEQAQRVASVWDVAEEYARVGLPYDRTILQDRFHLIGALRKPEYGGMADLTGLNDPRLTPELVREVMEARKTAKDAVGQENIQQAIVNAREAGSNVRIPKIGDNTTIMQAISEHGGLSLEQALTLTGEKRPKTAPGVFTRKGTNIDEMARMLSEDGYPIDLNDPNDPGGIQQATALIERARRGDKVYPMAHDHDAMIARTQDLAAAKAFAESFDMAAVEEVPFDSALWQQDFESAVQTADLSAVYERIGELPEGMSDQLSVNGVETWRDYVSRVADEVAAKVEADARDLSIAEAMTRADDAMLVGEVRAEYAETRNLLKEKFVEAFDLTEEQATAYMELSDAVSGWYQRLTGESGEAFYSRYYDDVRASDQSSVSGEGLEQVDVNRRMTAQEINDYARALVREGSAELRRAVKNENMKADRIAILDAAYKLNPEMAKNVAKQSTDVLFQGGKFKDVNANANLRTINLPDTANRLATEGKKVLASEVRKILKDLKGLKDKNGKVPNDAFMDRLTASEHWVELRREMGFADPKGAVTFDADGIKATIHAFESKDFSTLVHENAHVFRRMLADVANRTDNVKVKADLRVIEEWAGVKDGQWDRTAEEKFARGFERYLADGKAPTPKLRAAFESFKNWILEVYRQITGSAIDVKLTDDVRAVFDRMLGEEGRKAVSSEQLSVSQPRVQENLAKVREGKRITFPTLEEYRSKVTVEKNERGQFVVVQEGADRTFRTTVEGAGSTDAAIRKVYDRQKAKLDEAIARPDSGFLDEVQASQKMLKEAYSQPSKFIAWNEAKPGDMVADGKELVRRGINKKGDAQILATETGGIVMLDGKKWAVVKDVPTVPDNPNILFQDNTQPVGALDAASQFLPHSEVMDEGWSKFVKPLLGAMEEGAVEQVTGRGTGDGGRGLDGAVRDMSPEGQTMLRQYMAGVKNDMATSKLAAMRWGEQRRDFAMLNYNKRYGFDRTLDVFVPYQFFYTRSMVTWAARALDTPAWYSNYARLKMQQQRYERDIPERLRNKIKIPAPWLPDWAGDALYIDPLGSLFTPANFLKPFERAQQEKTQQQMEAERILQEWANDGTMSQAQISEAAQSQSGSAWERALAEAQIRRESEIASPIDFFTSFFGPAWYITTPLSLAGIKFGPNTGSPEKISSTPLANTVRALDTVTQGTWAEPIGDVLGLLGKPEEWARKKAGLPTLGEYGEYYTKRQIANMVAEGMITSEQAQMAMIEKQGELWDQATERVKLELAMRVPTMGAIYAGLHGENLGEGLKGFSQAMLPTLFGSGLLPEGELEYRGLKQEWNEAWAKYDRGDTKAVNEFFDEHPEYEAYLAKGKDDAELMQSFLIGQVWDGYMALGPTNQKQAKAEMGEEFATAFLNKETRSYESIDTETLTQWAQMLNKMVPSQYTTAASTTPTITAPLSADKRLDLYDPGVTRITDEFFTQRTNNYGNYYELEQGYYALPKSQRGSYLLKNPDLKEYWDWKKKWFKTYPDLVPILKGQVFKRVDTSGWAPGLEFYVQSYAFGGDRLPKGAYKALEQVWIMEGRPMDDLDTWLNSTVVPAMLYGNE